MRQAALKRIQRTFQYVVVYDVSDDRRRDRVASALLDVGIRVGLSVFEARLTPGEAGATLARLECLLNPETDRLHLYRLCSVCNAAGARLGVPWRQPDPAAVAVL